MAESEGKVERRHLVSQYAVTMDEAYDLAGGHGKYQYLVGLSCCVTMISTMLYLFSIPMFLMVPKTNECSTANDAGIPICNISVTSCTNKSAMYRYENPHFNFVSEYNLLCDDVRASVIASAFSIGGCISCLLFSALSDAIGRLPVLFIGEVGMIGALGYLVLFSSYEVCVTCTIITGFFALAGGPPSFSFAYDSMHSKYIPVYSTFINAIFAVGEILVALVMWTQVTWRTMCVLILCWHTVFFILFCFLYESPRFLANKGKHLEAGKVLERIAKLNSVSIPRMLRLKDTAAVSSGGSSFLGTIKTLLSPRVLCQLIICSSIFLASGFVYFGIAMSVQKSKGNVYVNVIVNGVAEIIAVSLSGVAAKKWGNKASAVGFLAVTGGAVVLQNMSEDNVLLSSCSLYLAKFGISAVYNIAYICAGELFPTSIKGTALGINVLCGRAGALVAPMVSLDKELLATYSIGLCLLSLIASLFLSSVPKNEPSFQPPARDELAEFKAT